jgi:hypothetical protein
MVTPGSQLGNRQPAKLRSLKPIAKFPKKTPIPLRSKPARNGGGGANAIAAYVSIRKGGSCCRFCDRQRVPRASVWAILMRSVSTCISTLDGSAERSICSS